MLATVSSHMIDAPSGASALLFAGVTSVALSPAVVLLATVVLHHNDLILLAIGSAFVWLLAITVCASFWWATASLGDGSRLVIAVLSGAPVQEASRWLTYALYLRLLRGLHSGPLPPAAVSLHAMAPSAVANGVGIGLMQTLVMFGDTATRSLLPGSLYTDACASLSLFAVNALCALGMLLVNVLLSLLGWLVAYPRRSRTLGGVLVALHLLASASTLSNSPLLFPADGCVVALPCLFGTVAATGLLTAYLVSVSFAPDHLAVAPPRVAVVRKTR